MCNAGNNWVCDCRCECSEFNRDEIDVEPEGVGSALKSVGGEEFMVSREMPRAASGGGSGVATLSSRDQSSSTTRAEVELHVIVHVGASLLFEASVRAFMIPVTRIRGNA